MRRTLRILLRVLIIAVSLSLGVALAEGGYKLVTGHSLIDRLLMPEGGVGNIRTGFRDDERIDAGDLTEGASAIDPDIDVGYTMKWSHERSIVDAIARTDSFGQRVRVGPAPEDGALRIVLLGDSVAFGFGVTDDETFGHHLENTLAATMADGARRPIVSTVACPGWNNRAEVRYLLNHIGRLDPDIVILLAVTNDLDDHARVNEFGGNELGFDPAEGVVRPHIGVHQFWQLWNRAKTRLPRVTLLRQLAHGSLWHTCLHAPLNRLGPESKRRWRGLGERMQMLQERLSRRGCKLMLALRFPEPIEMMLDDAIRGANPEIPVRYFFNDSLPYDRLEKDSHPSTAYTRAGAWCMADELIKQGWVSGSGARPLPDLDERYRARLTSPLSLKRVRESLAEAEARWREHLKSTIDMETGVGFHQVYGGLSPDGTVGRHILFQLANPGETHLRLHLDRLPESDGVYPLELTATFNGAKSVARDVPAPASNGNGITLSFPIPPEVRSADVLDIQVDSSNWIARPVRERTSLAAWLFRSATLFKGKDTPPAVTTVTKQVRPVVDDLGLAKPGRNKVPPSLALRFAPGRAPMLLIRNGPRAADGHLAVSRKRKPQNAFGGTIIPDLESGTRIQLKTDADGNADIVIPQDLRTGEIFAQAGFADATTTKNTAISNALRITWP